MKRTNLMRPTAMAIFALLALVVTFSACSNDEYEVGGSSVIKTRAARHDDDAPEPVPIFKKDTIRACTQDSPYELIVSNHPETNDSMAFCIHVTWTEGVINGIDQNLNSNVNCIEKFEGEILHRSPYGELERDNGVNFDKDRYVIHELSTSWENDFHGVHVFLRYSVILHRSVVVNGQTRWHDYTYGPFVIDGPFGDPSDIALKYIQRR